MIHADVGQTISVQYVLLTLLRRNGFEEEPRGTDGQQELIAALTTRVQPPERGTATGPLTLEPRAPTSISDAPLLARPATPTITS